MTKLIYSGNIFAILGHIDTCDGKTRIIVR